MGEEKSGTRATTRRSAKAAVLAVFFAAAALLGSSFAVFPALLGSSFAASPASASESAIGPDGKIYVIESRDTSSILKKYTPSIGTEEMITVDPTNPNIASPGSWFGGDTQAWNEGLAGRLTTGKNYTEQLHNGNRIFTNDTRAQNNDPTAKDIFIADDGTIYIFEDLYEGLTVGYYPRDTVYRRSDDDTKLLTLYVAGPNINGSSTSVRRGESDPRFLADPKNAGIFNSSGAFQTHTGKNLYRSYPQFWSDEYIGSEYFPTRNIPSQNSSHFSISTSSDEYELPCWRYDANTSANSGSGAAITCTGFSGNRMFTDNSPNNAFWNGSAGAELPYKQYWRPYKLLDEFGNQSDENACGMYLKQKLTSAGGIMSTTQMYFGHIGVTDSNAQYADEDHLYNEGLDYDSDANLKKIFSILASSDSSTQIGTGGLTEAEVKALPNNTNTDFDNTIRIPFGLQTTSTTYAGSRDFDPRSGDYTNSNFSNDINLTYSLHGHSFWGGISDGGWYRVIAGYDRFDRNIYPRNDYYKARGRVLIGAPKTPPDTGYDWTAEEVDLSGFGPSPTPYITDAAFDESGNLYVLATFYSDYYGSTGANKTSWDAMKKLLGNTTRERTFIDLNGTLTTYGPGNTISASDRGSIYPSPNNGSGVDILANSYAGIHDMICTSVSGASKGKGTRVVLKFTKQGGYSTASEVFKNESAKSLDDIIWDTAIIDDASIASHETTNDWLGASIALSTDSSDGTSDRMFVATQSSIRAYDLDGTPVSGATFNLKTSLNTNKTALHSSCREANLGDYDPYRIRSLEADDHVVSVHFSRNGQSGASSVMLLSKEDLSLLKYDNGTSDNESDDVIQVYGECGDGAANYNMDAKYPSDLRNNNTNLGAVNLAIKTRIDRTEGAATYGDLDLLYFGKDDPPSTSFIKKRLIEGLVGLEPESNLDRSSFFIMPYDGTPFITDNWLENVIESAAGNDSEAVQGMWSFKAGAWKTHEQNIRSILPRFGSLVAGSIVVVRMSSPEKAKAALSGFATIKSYYDSTSLNTTLKGGWNIVYCHTGSASPTMGITVPEEDGGGVLAVFTWGDNQNPNTWTHVALPTSPDTDLPEGYLELNSIAAGDIAAVYLDINEAAKDNTYSATC